MLKIGCIEIYLRVYVTYYDLKSIGAVLERSSRRVSRCAVVRTVTVLMLMRDGKGYAREAAAVVVSSWCHFINSEIKTVQQLAPFVLQSPNLPDFFQPFKKSLDVDPEPVNFADSHRVISVNS